MIKDYNKRMCNFLKINYSQEMIDTKKFMGLGKNTKKWKPNSNFKSPQKGITSLHLINGKDI